MYEYLACMYVCTPELMELQLQMVASHYRGAGNQTQYCARASVFNHRSISLELHRILEKSRSRSVCVCRTVSNLSTRFFFLNKDRVSTLSSQEEAKADEFRASLAYIVSSRTAKAV